MAGTTIYWSKTGKGDFIGWPPAYIEGSDFAGWGRLWDFDLSKSDLKSEHKNVLGQVGGFLRENPTYFCRIVGLASRSGTRGFNKMVSDRRARNVHGYLTVVQDVTADQLTSRAGSLFFAFGEDAWDPRKHVDGGQKGYVERGKDRLVVLLVWTHNNPNINDEMRLLNNIMEGRLPL